jgi:hypothetical protein
MNKQIITLDVNLTDTIADIKGQISTATNILFENERLICGSKNLENNRTFAYYNINAGSTLRIAKNINAGFNSSGIRSML